MPVCDAGDNNFGLTRKSRMPKILPYRYLKQYDRSLYIDANLEVIGALHALFARLDACQILFFRHPEGRTDIYTEADVCISMGKDDPEMLNAQVSRYRALGFAGRAAEDLATIPAGMAILRRHNDPQVQQAMELWWSEYVGGSKRDQISLPYALHQSDVVFDLIEDNVRRNEWFVWRKHYNQQATKSRLAAYDQAGAIVLHAKGAETRLQHLLLRAKQVPEASGKARRKKRMRLLPKPILLDDNILGVSPHGAPDIEIIGSKILQQKPVALLCEDPALYEAHAISSAEARGIKIDDREAVLSSPVYGTARRRAFEEAVKAFLEVHSGPTAILHQSDLEKGDLGALLDWLGRQGKPKWPVKLRSLL